MKPIRVSLLALLLLGLFGCGEDSVERCDESSATCATTDIAADAADSSEVDAAETTDLTTDAAADHDAEDLAEVAEVDVLDDAVDATRDSAEDLDTTQDLEADIVAATLLATESYEHEVFYGWLVAGQPTEARLTDVVAQGAVVLSLRAVAEESFDEEALVVGLGGTFIRYPTGSADFNTPSFREFLYDLYDGQLAAGALVYLHCGASSRAGASWALYQAERKAVPAEEAVQLGLAAGMSSLEAMVRGILGV